MKDNRLILGILNENDNNGEEDKHPYKRYTFNLQVLPTDDMKVDSIPAHSLPQSVLDAYAAEIAKYPDNQIIVYDNEFDERAGEPQEETAFWQINITGMPTKNLSIPDIDRIALKIRRGIIKGNLEPNIDWELEIVDFVSFDEHPEVYENIANSVYDEYLTGYVDYEVK